ncbi:MAG TPA: PAS domain S-box protein [Rubrivivax sp.]
MMSVDDSGLPQAPGLPAAADLKRLFWASPLAATLQDASHRLVDVNDAFVAFSGFARGQLVGRDPLELQPEEDRANHAALREMLMPRVLAGETPPLQERRLIDARGVERWFRAAAYGVRAPDGQAQVLAVLHDSTGEHVARAQAERSIDELSQWFDLSPTGMLVFDETGLIVRSNPAFEALVGQVPVLLPEAAADLQSLLGWRAGAPDAELRPGAPVLECEAVVQRPDGHASHLSARLRAFATGAGERRFMAVVEDRSAEDERDLAQLEIGALMSTAGIGVATYDSTHGWRRSPQRAGAPGVAAPDTGLQSISRDLVEPSSRAEYEKLQRALRNGQRAEVRYAVRHPDLGLRWLLTRVEPAELGSGSKATSVVTLDVTERELAQRRSDELLRELTTILDGSPAGIAYLRDGRLVRCNRRFERMLGFAPGAVAGAALDELFRNRPAALPAVTDAAAALAGGKPFDVELPGGLQQGAPVWYSLSVRRAEPAHAGAEAVAVLTDISRLKAGQAELETLLRERELMFSLSEVGIAWLRGRHIERANQALGKLLGLVPAELSGLDLHSLHEDRSAAIAFDEATARALQAQGRYTGEWRLRQRDGTLRWVQLGMRSVEGADTNAGVICSFVDIDDRQRARESLQLLAGRTRSVLDSVLVGIVTVGDHGIEWMNRSARRMFAGELGDFAGEPVATVATNERDHPLRRTDWLERLADGQSETFECRLKGRDGREFWVVGNAVATTRDSAVGRQVTFALLDIEARRQAEVSIARAQASLQRVIETAPLAIALFDAKTQRVGQLNQMAAAFFGRPLDELQGQRPADWCDAFGADESAAMQASLQLAADSPDGVRREITRPAPDGSAPRRWDTRFVTLAASDGSGEDANQVLLVASDVTEQRAAEQERFDAAIAQREMLVKEVHHRIKNNLQGVAGLLQQAAVRRPEVATILSEAVSQVQAIAQVYGLQVGAGGPLELSGVLAAIAGSVQRTFGQPITVDLDADKAHDWLLPEAESIPLALLLNELLTNAVKHGAGSPVSCRLAASSDGVAIVIANGGQLRAGFDIAAVPAGVYGLGLVRALLPRRSATLALAQEGTQVVARVALRVPSVQQVARVKPAVAAT